MTILARARLALDIPVELARALEAECRKRNMTKTDTVVQAIRNHIANKEELSPTYFEKLKEDANGKQVVSKTRLARRVFAGNTTSRRSSR